MKHLHNESLSFTCMHGSIELRVHLHIDHIEGTMAITPERYMIRKNEDPYDRRERQTNGFTGEYFGFINGKEPGKWFGIAKLINEATEYGAQRLAEVKKEKLVQFIQPGPLDPAT